MLPSKRLLGVAVAVIGLAAGVLSLQALVELGVQYPFRKRLLQLVDQAVLAENTFGSRPARS
jgi:hypothetical protein